MANLHRIREAKRLVSFSTPPPRQNNGADGLTTKLRRAILAGQYTFKERLPSERQLAEHFNASRGTVRKVLQRLTSMNLVEQRAGSGTYVRHGEFADRIDIADVTSPLELIDVRSGIELQIAQLAVTNATVVDIEHITSALDQLEQCDHDPERFTLADSEFHLALAESTHNPLLVWLYQLLNEVRSHAQWRTMKDQILTPERINRYNRQHRRLLAAIISRDADGATKTIQQHLDQARRDLRGVIG